MLFYLVIKHTANTIPSMYKQFYDTYCENVDEGSEEGKRSLTTFKY